MPFELLTPTVHQQQYKTPSLWANQKTPLCLTQVTDCQELFNLYILIVVTWDKNLSGSRVTTLTATRGFSHEKARSLTLFNTDSRGSRTISLYHDVNVPFSVRDAAPETKQVARFEVIEELIGYARFLWPYVKDLVLADNPHLDKVAIRYGIAQE